MDPKLILYLKNIVSTILCGIIWMGASTYWGIHKNLGFFETNISWKNILFYFLSLGSLIALFIYMHKIWKKPLDIEL